MKLTTDIEDNVDAIRDAIYEEIKEQLTHIVPSVAARLTPAGI